VGGELDHDGTGYLSVVLPSFIILVRTKDLINGPASTQVLIRSFREVEQLTVDARHNHFEDSANELVAKLEFVVTAGPDTLTFRTRQSESKLLSAESVVRALSLLSAGR
jgi:hypothetical protein